MKEDICMKYSKVATAIIFWTFVLVFTLGQPIQVEGRTALQIVTASMGGDTYFWAAVASKTLNEVLTDYEFSVRAGTTSANIVQLEKGEIQLAYAHSQIYAAMYGREALNRTRLREVWPMNNRAYMVVVAKDSPVRTIADLKGKKVSCGIKTGEGAMFLEYLAALGLSKDDYNLFFIGKAEGIEAFKSGSVDAVAGVTVFPSSMFSQLASSRRGARLVGWPDTDLDRILPPRRPFEFPGVIPGGIHPDIPKDVRTIFGWDPLCARDDFSPELVYRIAKALHTHHKDLVQAFPPAKDSTAENFVKFHGFPIHQGTERLLKELNLAGAR
jgi:uncharacterized protein